jgi:hypothetical protein
MADIKAQWLENSEQDPSPEADFRAEFLSGEKCRNRNQDVQGVREDQGEGFLGRRFRGRLHFSPRRER